MISRRAYFGLSVACAAGCATVPPGHAAVLVEATGGVQSVPLGEGAHLIAPLARIDLYDLRGQEQNEDLSALTADGAPVQARASLVTYRLIFEELPSLDREVGPDYYRVLIRPIVRSTVRRVLAGYRADALSSAAIRAAQQEIGQMAAARLRPYHILVDDIDIRRLAVVLSSRAYSRILETGTLEQEALSRPQRLEIAERRADALRELGRSIAAAHALIAPTLDRSVLVDEAVRAETRLLTAPSTQIIVVDSNRPFPVEVTP